MNRVLRLIPISKVWRNKVAQYGDLWRLNKRETGTVECQNWLMETAKPVHAGGYPYNKWGVNGVDFTVEEVEK